MQYPLRTFAICGALALALGAFQPSSAKAFSRGVSFVGCDGCHGSGTQTTTLTSTPMSLSPGATARFTVRVDGSGSVAGIYVLPSNGDFAAVSGGGMSRSENGLSHDGPRNVSGGVAEFLFEWTAPATPGAVRFDVSSVLGNGNGRSSGDEATEEFFDLVYGCEPQVYFRDFDGDGFGRESRPQTFCAGAPEPGFAATGDDCNDSDAMAFPGATDVCNQRDDDCNGVIDDNAVPTTHYPDADRDGYYSLAERESGETFFGCSEAGGRWAALPGDCAPNDPMINPNVEEVCNLLDDDCDADVDERVRPQCGQGWCRRNARTCEADTCEPGDPLPETCNFFDDDCDGAIDEDSCADGEVCEDFECRPRTSNDPPPMMTPMGTGGDGDIDGGCQAGGSTPGVLALVLLAFLALRRRRSPEGR
ncbi:MAG: putative metal-binding motif-containing protein [Myxococcota bacterium]